MARRPPLPKKPVSTEAVRRATLARDIQAIGAPLEKQVATRAGPADGKLRPHLAGLGLACAAASLALIGASLPAIGAAGAALYAVGYVAMRRYARRGRTERLAPAIELAGKFDEFVAAQLPRLPEAAAESLQRIKTLLARVLPALGDARASAALTQEEAFFAREAISRYLPDAVRPFLALAPDRADAAAGPGARSPRDLLLEQLAMVERELARIDERLAAATAEELARNKKLLERRTSS
ncbi:MAG TPA: hypothetical protein VGF58_14765 [Burkholderiales bacterium]|jgi:hypothetical protein